MLRRALRGLPRARRGPRPHRGDRFLGPSARARPRIDLDEVACYGPRVRRRLAIRTVAALCAACSAIGATHCGGPSAPTGGGSTTLEPPLPPGLTPCRPGWTEITVA